MPKIRCPNCGTTIDLESRKDIDLDTIVRALENHPRRFTELLHLTGLPRKTFNARLKLLCDKGIIAKGNGEYKLNGTTTLVERRLIERRRISMRKAYYGLKKNALLLAMMFAITSPFTFPVIVDALGIAGSPPQFQKVDSRTTTATHVYLKASLTIKEKPPYFVGCPATLTFDASFSYGNITEYSWEFSDGTIEQGRVVTHAYTIPGSYYVTLTVTDSEGRHSTVQKMVVIQPQPKTYVYFEAAGNNTVNLAISEVENLYAWSVEIAFNPTEMHIASITEGDFLKTQAGKFGTLTIENIDNERGLITLAVTMLGEPLSGATGSGILVTITWDYGTLDENTFQLQYLTLLESCGKDIPYHW